MGERSVPDSDLAEHIAAVAHEAWRRRMTYAGWVAGSHYSEPGKVHDALVPFEELNPADRRATLSSVRLEKMEAKLAALVEYPREPDRPFTLEEMRPGLSVTSAIEAGPASTEHGVVESWEADEDGTLRMIQVRWDDGDLTEHHPAARELRRASS